MALLPATKGSPERMDLFSYAAALPGRSFVEVVVKEYDECFNKHFGEPGFQEGESSTGAAKKKNRKK